MSKEYNTGDKAWFVRYTKNMLAIVEYGEVIEINIRYLTGVNKPWRTYRMAVDDGYGRLSYETDHLFKSWYKVHEIARKNNTEVLERFGETVKNINGENVEAKSKDDKEAK